MKIIYLIRDMYIKRTLNLKKKKEYLHFNNKKTNNPIFKKMSRELKR